MNTPIRRWRTKRRIARWQRESDNDLPVFTRWVDDSQSIQLVREHRNEGSLWVGRCSDSLQFDAWLKAQGKKGVQVSVGHDAPPAGERPDVAAFHYTISDGSNSVEDWLAVQKIVRAAVKMLREGTPIFVNCDMGASRSRTLASIILSMADGVPFSEYLRTEIRNRNYDGLLGADFPPNPVLWNQARVVVDMMQFEDETLEESP